MGEIRAGVVGLGQGGSHLRALQLTEGARVVAVCDLDRALAERVAREHGIPRHYTALDDLLSDDGLDAVVIATPDHLHGQHAIRALEAGKHVLSEIPMATSLEECARIVELAERAGLKYQMGNQVRYAFCLRDVRRLVSGGAFGEVFYGEGEYLHNMGEVLARRSPGHWRVAPSNPQTTLLGGGPHAIDTLRWLMGGRFVEAQAYHAAQRSEWHTLHTTSALFRTDSGAVAKVTVSYGMVRPYCLYFSVYGTRGSFERTRDQGEATEDTVNYLYHDALSGASRMIPVTLPNWRNPSLDAVSARGHGTMEVEQACDFVRAIREDAEPPLGPREAFDSIAAGVCALRSAERGGGPVRVPSYEELSGAVASEEGGRRP